MVLSLAAQQSENRIATTGDVPEIGAPINYPSAFAVGTQVSAVANTPGGTPLSMNLTADISNGNTQFTVSSTTGIVPGLAANNGSGDAIFVNNAKTLHGAVVNSTLDTLMRDVDAKNRTVSFCFGSIEERSCL